MSSFLEIGNVITTDVIDKTKKRNLMLYSPYMFVPETLIESGDNSGYNQNYFTVLSYIYNSKQIPIVVSNITRDSSWEDSGVAYIGASSFSISKKESKKLEFQIWFYQSMSSFNSLFDVTFNILMGEGLDSNIHFKGSRFSTGEPLSEMDILHEPTVENGIKEILEWNTAVLCSYWGEEQRVAKRERPRRFFEFTFLEWEVNRLLLQEFFNAEKTVKSENDNITVAPTFYFPLWTEPYGINNDILYKGSTYIVLYCPNECFVLSDFHIDDKVLIENRPLGLQEIHTISDIYWEMTRIHIYDTIKNTFPYKDTVVYPLNSFFPPKNINIKNITDRASEYTFVCEQMKTNNDFPDSEEWYTSKWIDFFLHSGSPDAYNFIFSWERAFNEVIEHNWEVLDNKIGLPSIVHKGPTKHSYSNLKLLLTQDCMFGCDRDSDCYYFFKCFLYWARGRYKDFYVKDIPLAREVILDKVHKKNEYFIVIKNIGQHLRPDSSAIVMITSKKHCGEGFRDSMDMSNTMKVTKSEYDPKTPDIEVLVLDELSYFVNVEFSPEKYYLTLLNRVRFDSDKFEIVKNGSTFSVNLSFKDTLGVSNSSPNVG